MDRLAGRWKGCQLGTIYIDYLVPDKLTPVPPEHKRKAPMPPMSIGLLKAMTPDNLDGYDLVTRCWDEQAMGRYDVQVERPDILCMSALTTSASRAYEIATHARDTNGAGGKPIQIAIGGVHATALPLEALHYADCVALGETAPSTLRDILSWLIQRRKTGSSEQRAFEWHPPAGAKEVENRPLPDWSWAPRDAYLMPFSMQTSVGCPFDCSFCSVTYVFGSASRHVPYDVIEADARRFKSQGRGVAAIIDDNFLPNKTGEHAKKVCEIFRRYRIPWATELTALTLYNNWRELIPLLGKSGCRGLFLGIETITGKMAKSVSVEKYKELIARLHDYGIAVLGAFVFGVTEDDDPSLFERTVEWGIEAKLDLAQFSVNTPEPGARDFEYAVRNDLITDWNWEHYDAEHPVRKFAKITPQQMFEGHTNANRWFYTATSAWKRLKPSFKDLLNLRNGRRGTLVSAINAYLAGTARHYAARHNYAAFERSRITIPNPFVIQQFAPGMPENQFDAKTRARALLNNGHNPLRDVIPNVTFG